MEDIHISLKAETLFHIGPFPFTNSFLTMLIVMALLLLVGAAIARKAQAVPSRGQGAFELVVEFLLNLAESAAGRQAGRRVFPLIGSIFIFIAFANYTGILPGIGTVGVYKPYEGAHGTEELEGEEVEELAPGADAHDAYAPVAEPLEVAAVGAVDRPAPAPAAVPAAAEEGALTLVPFFRPPNADLNMTLAMALVTFTMVQILGIRTHGVGGRIKHMADPPFLFPIELISEFSRIISLSARLFGNVFAGEVLLTIMVTLSNAIKVAIIPVLIPVIFIGLELLFGTIQALVFALLTLIYITLASASHGDHAHDHDAPHASETHTEGAHGLGNVPSGAAD
jgi:F-type H+-transporting ATPase subunit a